MALSNVSGFPRIGRNRELKFATEGYWRGETSAEELAATAKAIRVENWKLMQDAGIDLIPSNDFSYYDQVLDTIALVGAVPERYGWGGGEVDLDTYFAMARGRQTDDVDVTAMEMTKWFDTNYHYIVPELGPETRFSLSASKPFDEHAEAMQEAGIDTVPVLIGPVSFLLLSKPADGVDEDFDPLDLIEPLVEVYGEVIERLAEQGATWVQLDEPCFVEDRSERELDALRLAYEELCKVHERPADPGQDLFRPRRRRLRRASRPADRGRRPRLHGGGTRTRSGGPPVARARRPAQRRVHRRARGAWRISGCSPGSSTAATSGSITSSTPSTRSRDCATAPPSSWSRPAARCCTPRSTSTPSRADGDADLDDEARSWMAFAVQKVGEVATLAKGLAEGRPAIAEQLDANDRAHDSRRESHRTRNPEVRARVEALTEADARRDAPFAERKQAQQEKLGLPTFPATTIGSFPADRRDPRRSAASSARGDRARRRTRSGCAPRSTGSSRFQEEIGLDVLVHGEPERNDMVQYFGEQMLGFIFTENAWVQSYGSRYVRPPIIFGDVSRAGAR